MAKAHTRRPDSIQELQSVVAQRQAAFDAKEARRVQRAGARATSAKFQAAATRRAASFTKSLTAFASKAADRIGAPLLGPVSNLLAAPVGPTAPAAATTTTPATSQQSSSAGVGSYTSGGDLSGGGALYGDDAGGASAESGPAAATGVPKWINDHHTTLLIGGAVVVVGLVVLVALRRRA